MLIPCFVTVPAALSTSDPATFIIPAFPNEITKMIIECIVEKTDLKAIRLAIKGADEYVIPLLYDNIHLSLSPYCLGNTEQILRHYPGHVRRISISPCMNKEIWRRDYSDRVYHTYKGSELREWGRHIETGYNNYVKEMTDMRHVLESRTLGFMLGSALRELPNVRRVVLDATPKPPRYLQARLRNVGVLLPTL